MKLSLSPSLVKQSLSSHAWLGLFVGALIYLVCLSGSLAVFYKAFERWEQPTVAEYRDYSPAAIQRALETLVASDEEITDHLFVNLPTSDMPRASIATENAGWFLERDGALGEKVDHAWTHLLVYLHFYLHLPHDFGLVLVSALGAMLCALILSGLLSHPRLFRDAFTLRLKGSRHLEQADIHNRLSVWGAPFHLMIAVTGAYFGLTLLVTFVIATAFFDGDREAAVASVFGEEPEVHQPGIDTPDLQRALVRTAEIAPDAEPFYITVHDAGKPEQHVDVGARHPDRLIWAERYQFDAAGEYLGKAGFSDGEPGKQAIFSVYRLHFGHFGGLSVKVVYVIFGLALTVVSVTGINIWLVRRKTRDSLNNLWTGFVWGAPAALALTAITQVIFAIPSTALFWLGLAVAMAAAQWLDNDARGKRYLQLTTAVLLTLLVVAHVARFGGAALTSAPLGVNVSLAAVALFLFWRVWRRRPAAVAEQRQDAGPYAPGQAG